MIPCDFCSDPATYAYVPQGVAWDNDSVHFCREHLIYYYLGLHYERHAA